MRQLTLKVKESKFRFLIELLKNFDFVQVDSEDEDSKEAILKNIREGLKEVQLIKQKKLKTRSAKDFLNEL